MTNLLTETGEPSAIRDAAARVSDMAETLERLSTKVVVMRPADLLRRARRVYVADAVGGAPAARVTLSRAELTQLAEQTRSLSEELQKCAENEPPVAPRAVGVREGAADDVPVDPNEVAGDPVLRLLALGGTPTMRMTDLAERVWAHAAPSSRRSLATRRVKDLVERGLVKQVEDGKTRWVEPTPRLLAATALTAQPLDLLRFGQLSYQLHVTPHSFRDDRPRFHIASGVVPLAQELLVDASLSRPVHRAWALAAGELLQVNCRSIHAPHLDAAVTPLPTNDPVRILLRLVQRFTTDRANRIALCDPLAELAGRLPRQWLAPWAAMGIVVAGRVGGSRAESARRTSLLARVCEAVEAESDPVSRHLSGIAWRVAGKPKDAAACWEAVVGQLESGAPAADDNAECPAPDPTARRDADYRVAAAVNLRILRTERSLNERYAAFALENRARPEWLGGVLHEQAARECDRWLRGLPEHKLRQHFLPEALEAEAEPTPSASTAEVCDDTCVARLPSVEYYAGHSSPGARSVYHLLTDHQDFLGQVLHAINLNGLN